MSDGEDIRVQLARMEGKQDVTNERLNNVQVDINDLRRVQHNHANDIQLLKTDKSQRDGKAQGLSISGRIVGWGVSLLAGTGLGAGLWKLIG